jgi:F5/8 type C domain-containing protein
MAVKFRAITTVTNTDGVSASSVSINKPTGTVDGDVLILVLHGYVADGGLAGVDSAGFELLDIIDDGSSHRSRAYKKIASSEPASYTLDFGGAGGAIGATLAAFSGGHDVLTWAHRSTSTTDPAPGYDLDAARDSVGYQVYAWRNDTANATVTWSFGTEKADITAKATDAIRRGQSAMYYGPTDLTDIVNAGDQFPAATADVSTAPLYGFMWTFLVGDKELDNETWSSTDGDFAVEVKMDRVELNSTGGITTLLTGDVTGVVSAFAASSETEAASNAADGLGSTNWLDDSTAAPQWLRYDFGASVTKTIKRYRITSAASGSTYGNTLDPMTWTLQGSQDASAWSTLDTRSGESFGNRGETREFRVATPGAYRYYRLHVTVNWGSAATVGCQLAEFRLSTVDVWEDITTYVQEADKIRITRGFQGTSGRSDFSRAYFTVDNTDGRFSLRNPNGAYHGAIQRNSETRISKAYGTKGLQLQGAVRVEGTDMIGDCFRAPLTYALAVTSDIDIRIDMDLETWHSEQSIVGMGLDSSAAEHGWAVYLDDDGKVHFTWVDTALTVFDVKSTIAVPNTTRQSLKVVLDANNGASGNTVTFYTATTFAGAYTQLGDAVVSSGITNIYYAGGSLSIGQSGRRSPRGPHGIVYNFELRNALLGTTVADLDFTSMTNGARTHTDAYDNLWIAVNFAVVSNRRYRFHGEIAEWPMAWDPTGNWVYVPITAAGVQKRLERASATGSAMYRHHTKGTITDPGFDFQRNVAYAYWPMEDGENSFQVSSGLPGKPHLEVYGSPKFAENSDFTESAAILDLNGSKLGGRVQGNPEDYVDVRFIMNIPSDVTPSSGANLITLWTTGSMAKFQLHFGSSTELDWHLYSEAALETGTPSFTSSAIAATLVGEKFHARVQLQQVGADISITVDLLSTVGDVLATSTQTASSTDFGRVYRVQVNDSSTASSTGIFMGHLAVYGTESPDWQGPINSWHYERAADRIERICQEESIEYRQIGASTKSTFMGYQNPDSPQAIMSSASHSDVGYLTDPLDAFGIEFRTGRSLFNQDARLTLSYTGFELSGELRPVDDDSYLVNDQVVQRGDAGSARFQLTEGALSINPPPDGVGPYSDVQSFSLANEGQCVDLASWFVAQGTLDEEHYPRIEVALENVRIAADAALTEAILLLNIGQRIDITDTPDFLPANDIRQIVVGYEEWFDNFQHNLKLNTIPERIFEAAQYDTTYRFDTAGSTLYQDISTSATSIKVQTDLGQVWSGDDEDFDIWVDGERMTCTAISNDSTGDTGDTFTRADSATVLGSTETGTTQAWVQDAGTWGIQTNRAYISAAATSFATILGAADFNILDVEVDVWTAGDAWLVFRFTDTSNYLRFGGTFGAAAQFDAVVAGVTTRTDITANILAQADELKVRCEGSVIEMFINDVLVLTVSETSNSTGTRVGLRTTSTNPRFDNFSYSQAASPQTFTVTRSVNGVTAAHPAGTAVSLYNRPYRAL